MRVSVNGNAGLWALVVLRAICLVGYVRECFLSSLLEHGSKRTGSTCGSWLAQRSGSLSQAKIRTRPYDDPAREGVQSPCGTAQVGAHVADSSIPHFSFLSRSSRMLAMPGFGGADGR